MDDVAHQFANLFHELKKDMNSFKDLWINFEEKAFYDILKMLTKKYDFPYPEEKLLLLAKKVKEVVDSIIKVNSTGAPGDGKIFVLPVEDSYRVRDAAQGEEVL